MEDSRREWQDPGDIVKQIGVGAGNRVADIGCGPGYFTLALSEAVGPSGEIYAVDADPIMVDELKHNLSRWNLLNNVRCVTADAYTTGIPSKTTDIVLFANILHDIEDKSRFFEEIKRISTQTARFVDIDWHKRSTIEMGPPVGIRLSEAESRDLLRAAGFRIVHALDAGPYHYGLVAKLAEKSQELSGD